MKRFFKVLGVFLLMATSCSSPENKCTEAQVQTELKTYVLQYSKMKPGGTAQGQFNPTDCHKMYDYMAILEREFGSHGLIFKHDGNNISVKNPKDPCGEDAIRARFAEQIKKYQDIQPGERKNVSYPASECDKKNNYKLILKEEYQKLGLTVEFTGVSEDGADSFTISK